MTSEFTTYLCPKAQDINCPNDFRCNFLELFYREKLFHTRILAIIGKGKSGVIIDAIKKLNLEALRKFYNGLMAQEWHNFDKELNIRFHGSERNGERDVKYLCRTLHIDIGNHMDMTIFTEQHNCDGAPSEFRVAYFVSGPGIRFSQGADFCNWRIREFGTGRYRRQFELFGG